jgi:FlaA1/EpsC-like NDP-sugar epimerase
MGATKMLAERLFTAADGKTDGTTFASVRLGNVLGTSGSVMRIFEEQIENGGPVTVTHPEMSRFMFSVTEAAEFIVESVGQMSGGEVFVPKMDAVRIMDLANVMIETTTPPETDPDDIEIDIIGIRPGERLHEQLLTEHEARTAIECDDFFVVTSQLDAENALVSDGGSELATACRSDKADHLSTEELGELLRNL